MTMLYHFFASTGHPIQRFCEPLKTKNQSCNSKKDGNPCHIKSKHIMQVIILSPPSGIPLDGESLLSCSLVFRPPKNNTGYHHQQKNKCGRSHNRLTDTIR